MSNIEINIWNSSCYNSHFLHTCRSCVMRRGPGRSGRWFPTTPHCYLQQLLLLVSCYNSHFLLTCRSCVMRRAPGRSGRWFPTAPHCSLQQLLLLVSCYNSHFLLTCRSCVMRRAPGRSWRGFPTAPHCSLKGLLLLDRYSHLTTIIMYFNDLFCLLSESTFIEKLIASLM
jgi:hypothetical protein